MWLVTGLARLSSCRTGTDQLIAMATKSLAEINDSADRIVICGGGETVRICLVWFRCICICALLRSFRRCTGIVGAAIAYYLSERGEKPIIIERFEVANAASGKAGGFLAGGWGDDSVTEQLHRVSISSHQRNLFSTLEHCDVVLTGAGSGRRCRLICTYR